MESVAIQPDVAAWDGEIGAFDTLPKRNRVREDGRSARVRRASASTFAAPPVAWRRRPAHLEAPGFRRSSGRPPRARIRSAARCHLCVSWMSLSHPCLDTLVWRVSHVGPCRQFSAPWRLAGDCRRGSIGADPRDADDRTLPARSAAVAAHAKQPKPRKDPRSSRR